MAKAELAKQINRVLEQIEPFFSGNLERRIQQFEQELQWIVDARAATHRRLRDSPVPDADPQFAGRVASAERVLERSVIAGELRLKWMRELSVSYKNLQIQLLGSLFFKPAPREDV